MSIYPDRKNGELTGRYRVEVQLNGQRRRGRANSLADAKALEADLLARLEAGEKSASALRHLTETLRGLTLGEGRTRAKGLLWAGQSTEAESFRKLERIVSIIGEQRPLDDFDANDLDKLMVELKTSGASDATVNRYLSNVSAFLKFCFKRGFRTVPVPEMDWRDEDEGRIRWITYAEEDALRGQLPEPFATLVYVAIRTGLRATELLSLKPEQVAPRWLHLWGTGTKNGSSRSVPITKDIYELLSPIVSSGAMPDYWQLRYEWDKAREAIGLKSDHTFVFHACRHTYATRAVQAGVNLRVLQKLMGHKAIQTTLRYAHVDDETLADAATKAIDFHAQRHQGVGEVGDHGGGTKPYQAHTAQRGATPNRRNAPVEKRSVSPARTANPYTPVRFRLGPPHSGSGIATLPQGH